LDGRYIIGRESPYAANEKAEAAAGSVCWAVAVAGTSPGIAEVAATAAAVFINVRRVIGFEGDFIFSMAFLFL
jgi:hypothetical protein